MKKKSTPKINFTMYLFSKVIVVAQNSCEKTIKMSNPALCWPPFKKGKKSIVKGGTKTILKMSSFELYPFLSFLHLSETKMTLYFFAALESKVQFT